MLGADCALSADVRTRGWQLADLMQKASSQKAHQVSPEGVSAVGILAFNSFTPHECATASAKEDPTASLTTSAQEGHFS